MAVATDWTPANLTEATVQSLVSAGTTHDGDRILLPAGSATWSTPLTTTKALVFMTNGSGPVVLLSNQATGGGDPSTMCLISIFPSNPGLLSGCQGIIFSNSALAGACGVYYGGTSNRICYCQFFNFKFATYRFGGACVVDHCAFTNNIEAARCYGSGTGSNEWFTLWPVSFTNIWSYAVLEDDVISWTPSYPYGGSGAAAATSGQGSRYIVRNCSIYNSSSEQNAPLFDWHGDAHDGTHGNLSSQVYLNTGVITGAGGIDKFVDARGGAGLVYSNTLTGSTSGSGRGIAVREEWPLDLPSDPVPHDLVTNMWVWNNTAAGSTLPTFVDDSTGLIVLNRNYFTSAPAPLLQPVYPHPLVGSADPFITVQPSNQTVSAPATATFSVTATGQSGLNYQWSKNGSQIAGATHSNYTTPSTIYPTDNGNAYFCVVSDLAGSAQSSTASLVVNPGGGLVTKTYGQGSHGPGSR